MISAKKDLGLLVIFLAIFIPKETKKTACTTEGLLFFGDSAFDAWKADNCRKLLA